MALSDAGEVSRGWVMQIFQAMAGFGFYFLSNEKVLKVLNR